jgi:hypothetical protein
MRLTHRITTMTVALAAVLGGLVLTAGAADAAPAAPRTLKTVERQVTVDGCAYYYDNFYWDDGSWAGYAEWSQDPCGGDPGDALSATDELADGYGINAHLSTGRVATTAGHSSPYTSKWKTGDLTEDKTYLMWTCVEKGGVEYGCTGGIYVSS